MIFRLRPAFLMNISQPNICFKIGSNLAPSGFWPQSRAPLWASLPHLAPAQQGLVECASRALEFCKQISYHKHPSQPKLSKFHVGSPTETLLRLLLPPSDTVHDGSWNQKLSTASVRIIHRITQSVGATIGAVYKGQGRNQHELMTRAYLEFLVEGDWRWFIWLYIYIYDYAYDLW